MKNRAKALLLPFAASVSLLSASLVFPASRSGDPKLDRAIESANTEWAAAMKTGDVPTIGAPYTEDSVFVGIDGACTKGRAEIEKMYRARFASHGPAASTKIESRKLVVDGDFAYESGYAEIGWSSKKDGKISAAGGRFLTVWQRQAGGEWKIRTNVVLP